MYEFYVIIPNLYYNRLNAGGYNFFKFVFNYQNPTKKF